MLVVDDEADLLESIGSLLETGAGVQVYKAQDGVQALALLERERVDLVVTDYKMPRMNGLDFLHRLAKRYPAIPSIMVTAYADFGVREELESLPQTALITKPFDPVVLLDQVTRRLGALAPAS